MESVISLVGYLFVIIHLHCFPVNCNPKIVDSMPGNCFRLRKVLPIDGMTRLMIAFSCLMLAISVEFGNSNAYNHIHNRRKDSG